MLQPVRQSSRAISTDIVGRNVTVAGMFSDCAHRCTVGLKTSNERDPLPVLWLARDVSKVFLTQFRFGLSCRFSGVGRPTDHPARNG